jgi:hypothetical protein
MTQHLGIRRTAALLLAALLPLAAAGADFEVTAPDGRRILLKADGTWRYVDADEKAPAVDKPKATGEAVLALERRAEAGPNCRFGLRLANNTNYEIRNIVPYFSAYRANGVLYETLSIGFYSINPGNNQYREVLFRGITCQEISRLQVSGGSRCEMGDLDRFSYVAGACLERVRVVPSELLQFDK